jgi:hypothetical protein
VNRGQACWGQRFIRGQAIVDYLNIVLIGKGSVINAHVITAKNILVANGAAEPEVCHRMVEFIEEYGETRHDVIAEVGAALFCPLRLLAPGQRQSSG